MKIAVTGHQGQLVRSLLEAPSAATVVAMGRPLFDLTQLSRLGEVLDTQAPDLVVNAAAYTAVDKAETNPDAALLINGAAAGAVAAACARRGIPIIQISTDFVFDGASSRPYLENDLTAPINVYGASKKLGEQLVSAANPRHLILRTSWVISPFGNNFVKTMLRLSSERPKLSVVDDQHGAPTYAPHLAAAILSLAQTMQNARVGDPRWGIYHVTNQGETTWHGLATEVFRCAAGHGGAGAHIEPIATSGYPTPARRPANSRLDGGKLSSAFGIVLPPWQNGVQECIARLYATQE
jgi:dTDP-4-dehydrorhamnose reductase